MATSARQNVVYDDLERPRLEQAEGDRQQRKNKAESRLPQERAVIAENATINRHGIKIADCRFQIELSAALSRIMLNLKSKI